MVVVSILWQAGLAAGAPLASYFESPPAEALIHRIDARAAAVSSLKGLSAEKLAQRRHIAREAGRTVVRDPETGVAVIQSQRWLAHVGVLLIETTLTNEGPDPVRVEGVVPIDWQIAMPAEDEGFARLSHRDDTWYGSTYWTGPDWTRVGRDWQHPGEHTPSVRTFLVPHDGRVSITGRAFKAHVAPETDGVRVAIRHGAETIWQAEIEGGDETGVDHDLTVPVRRGERLRFVVHKRQAIYCDTTRWDPVIAYDDGPSFRASEGFSTVQGQDGWYYEMEGQSQRTEALPRVFGFDLRAALRTAALHAGSEFAWGSEAFAPLFLLAADEDGDGVLVAVLDEGPWEVSGARDGEGIGIRLEVGEKIVLGGGESVELPAVAVGAYTGPWTLGMLRGEEMLHVRDGRFDSFRERMAAALGRGAEVFDADLRAAVTADPEPPAEFGLWVMLQAEYLREDGLEADTAESFAAATRRHLEGAAMLLDDLRAGHGKSFLAAEARQLERLAAEFESEDAADRTVWRARYQRVRVLKRRIALANPLLGDFREMLFVKRVPTSYSHLVMQYYGWRARPGGGLFVLERPGFSLACRDILAGRLAGGNVLEPRLSYDGRQIVFSFVDRAAGEYDPATVGNDGGEESGYYHVYSVDVDGSGLQRLTGGPFDDLMPTWLPDGGIAFSSTRRRGYARCFGAQFSPRWDVYTLHRMEADGTGIRTLSFHDTNEWFPAVAHNGEILYARWDYIDRDAVLHQNLWAMRPDGTNPRALWGNATPTPHCTFQIHPVPNSSKIVFTASAHHSITGGSIALVDPAIAGDGEEAITRITAEIPFPEAESWDIHEYYDAPWPLSETYFLVGYSPQPLVWEPGANPQAALGIYLLDAFGNRELIYRDPEIGSSNPTPIMPRPQPPVLASQLGDEEADVGELLLADVYEGLGNVPRGAIERLRVVQIFPKTTPLADQPPVGAAREENARAILGTVPVEADGSARFLVPARRPVLFQALDAEGFAYQTMRTVTYLQPGEKTSCVGCHEHRRATPAHDARELAALKRPPSSIDPGELGGRPFSYVEVVQPVLDRHCVGCHGGEDPAGGMLLTGEPLHPFTQSYVSLTGDVDFWGAGTNPENAARALVPRFGGRNPVAVTPPGGMYGALGSRLMAMLREGHQEVELSGEELRRLAAWIDLNAIFFGVYLPDDQARQLRGERVPMPDLQ